MKDVTECGVIFVYFFDRLSRVFRKVVIVKLPCLVQNR